MKRITRKLKSKAISISEDLPSSEEYISEEEEKELVPEEQGEAENLEQQPIINLKLTETKKKNNMDKLKLSISVIKHFSGNPDFLEEFLKSCVLAHRFIAEDEYDLLLDVMVNKLSGNAAQVVRGREIPDFKTLKSILEDHFKKKKEFATIMQEFIRAEQKSSVIEFANKIENLVFDLIELHTVDEKEEGTLAIARAYNKQGLHRFIDGLKEPLKTILKSRDYSNFNDAKQRAIAEEVGSVKPDNKNTVKAKCFKCGKLGHIAPKCRTIIENIKIEKIDKVEPSTSITCSICKKHGHVEKDCYFKDKEKKTFDMF